jgi:hypothetical protein
MLIKDRSISLLVAFFSVDAYRICPPGKHLPIPSTGESQDDLNGGEGRIAEAGKIFPSH